jgi:hypothetical protein
VILIVKICPCQNRTLQGQTTALCSKFSTSSSASEILFEMMLLELVLQSFSMQGQVDPQLLMAVYDDEFVDHVILNAF